MSEAGRNVGLWFAGISDCGGSGGPVGVILQLQRQVHVAHPRGLVLTTEQPGKKWRAPAVNGHLETWGLNIKKKRNENLKNCMHSSVSLLCDEVPTFSSVDILLTENGYSFLYFCMYYSDMFFCCNLLPHLIFLSLLVLSIYFIVTNFMCSRCCFHLQYMLYLYVYLKLYLCPIGIGSCEICCIFVSFV